MSPPKHSSLDVMNSVDSTLDSVQCLVCYRQIMLKNIHVPVQPHPTVNPPTPIIDIHNDQDDPICLAHSKAGAIRPRAQRLGHGVMPKAPVQVSSAKAISSDATFCTLHHAPCPNRPSHHVIIDQTHAPFCSCQCRFADHRSCPSAIDVEYNPTWRSSPCLPSAPTSFFSDINVSQDDCDCLSDASLESHSSAFSSDSDCAVNAYLRLSAIYDFAPLPPPPPFLPKATTLAKEPVPRLEGGIIMAARRIQAALCMDKCTKSSWGVPIHSDSEDDNKPIPGWTDGSNAWRPSVYGLAPPRDFTRTDPDDAAIRAYGSYVATPHRSRRVHFTTGKDTLAVEVQTTPSSSLPSSTVDASTQELYRQYCASFARRARSRTSTSYSTSRACSTGYSPPREIPLLKPGAEGRLLVPDVKMQLLNSPFSSVDGGSGKSNSPVVGGLHSASSQQNTDAGPNAYRTHSYKSEPITYPIMRVTPKKEKRVERRVIDGVERDVQEVEVLIEEPIKRLFLFGGARD